MKNLSNALALILIPALLLTACGDKKESASEKSAPEKKVNADLEKVIDELAACDEQNTNCEAYTKASEYIQAECEDEKKRDAIVDDLFTLIERGPSNKTQAAAHAVNFWTYGNFKQNPKYGKVVLNALKKEKYEQDNYTGSQLGQLLSGWFNTEDKELYASILDAVKDKNTEMRGRMELIRLIPYEKLSDAELFGILTDIINNPEEQKEVRIQCLNVLWRVENEDMKATARSIYEGSVNNPDIQIAGTSMLGLGYLKSFASYDMISAKLMAEKDNQDWYYYGSYCLSELVKNVPDSLDMNAVLSLVKTLITNKTVSAYSRSYYVGTLVNMNTSGSKALLIQLKSSGEEDIVKEINSRMK